MRASIRVLHVEDEVEFAEMTAEFVERIEPRIAVESVHTADDAVDRIGDGGIDCVVSDHDLGTTSGVELLTAVRASHPDLPFILFTGKGSEEIASEAITAGVTDYLQKGGTETFDLLANRITDAVARREQTRRFETLVENLPGLVYRVHNTPEWTTEFKHGKIESLTGYDADAILAGDPSWDDITHPDDAELVWEAVQAGVEAGEPYELTYRIIDADGEVRWMWERGKQVDERPDGVAILEGFITDITARKYHEQALTNERNRFAAIFDTVPEPAVHVVFENGTPVVRRVNEAFEEVFGIVQDEAAGRPIDDLIVPPSAADDAADINETVRQVGRHQAEIVRETASGARPFLFTARTMRFENGGDSHLEGVATYVDLSEQTRREAELERKNERLDTFVSMVSHDLRNPLNVAMGHLELATEDIENDHLSSVAEALVDIDDLIDQLVAYAREGGELGGGG